MTKSDLIKWSIARDALDFFGIGQIPPFSWLLDVPILCMHFKYAGPKACIAALELIPVLGTLPIFTLAAMCYPDHDTPAQGGTGEISRTVVRHRARSSSPDDGPEPPLYALIDGKLVPVVPDSREMEAHTAGPVRQLPWSPEKTIPHG